MMKLGLYRWRKFKYRLIYKSVVRVC